MMNKILIFGGIALSAILIIENIVINSTWMIFVYHVNWWFLVSASVFIWITIWFWIKWFLNKDSSDDENYDF